MDCSQTIEHIQSLHQEIRTLGYRLNQLNQQRTRIAKETRSEAGEKKDRTCNMSEETLGKIKDLVEKGKAIKTELRSLEPHLADLERQRLEQVSKLPNETHPDVPIGDETKARLLKTWHGPHSKHPPPPSLATSTGNADATANDDAQPSTNFKPENHIDILRGLDCLDLEAAVNASGSKMYYLKREAALLELALIQYGISRAILKGWTPIITPDIVRSDYVRGCGFQPRAGDIADQNYAIAENAADSSHPTRYLAATAEIPLAGLVCNRIVKHFELPKKYVAFGRAYRSEAKAGDGLYRVHQFSKVELFTACEPHQSEDMLEEIRELQEEIVQGLGLTYRVLDMPTEELGANAYRKYDIEAWMPGCNKWGEISSASNCIDYQSRRMGIRYRPTEVMEPSRQRHANVIPAAHAHTLNGTACAIPRLIIALVEQGQVRFEDGQVGFKVPEVLRPWMPGVSSVVRRHAKR